jgi:muramoyltetrapeptide carboxypeptidase
MTDISRRNFLAASGGALAATALPGQAVASNPVGGNQPPATLLAPALRPGDTIGIISPANATYQREPFDLAVETIEAMGFKVKPGRFWKARNSRFAGTDEERAADVNAMFADSSVHGILAMTGGSGCTRILDKLDYATIAKFPKVLGGFSDITALLNGIHARSGLVTFHAPCAESAWNPYSIDSFNRITMKGEALLQRNPVASEALPVQRKNRVRTITPGIAQGRLVGGNLTVLQTLIGTPYLPNMDGAILFLEDIGEYIYRIDRMLAHFKQAGALSRLKGVILGQFTDCQPGDGGYASFTLDEVFADYFGGRGIPVYSGAMFGHVAEKMTLPVGLPVEMDAGMGEWRLLTSAVRV